MIKIPVGEIVDHSVNARPSHICRRVLHPNCGELVDVKTPYLVVSAPLCRCIVNLSYVSGSPRCESAKGFLNDVALSHLSTYVVQGEGLQHGDVVL